MEWELKLHSTVDVITNSSTVIYTSATQETVNVIRSAVNALLKAMGSDKQADDLFTFKLDYHPKAYERARERYIYKHYPDTYRKNIQQVYDELEKENPIWWDDASVLGMYQESEYVFIKSKIESDDLQKVADLLSSITQTVTAEEYNTD